MAYDLEEQEQLATFKAWWAKYGNLVLTATTAALLAFAAWNGWKWYERREAAAASAIYAELGGALETNNAAKVKELAGSLIQSHGRTVHAAMAALHVARINHEAADFAAARTQLQWVIEMSGHDEFALVARVRLAGVLLDEKSYDEALKILAGQVPAMHQTAFADRRGDVLLAQGKAAEARAAWQQALDKAEAQHPLRQLIQLKIDAVPAPAVS
jgi:predicted negative regulator of RcsB-dependent stress response